MDSGSVLSLQSAILEAGVANAVTTWWDVSDDTAPTMMKLMYQNLLGGSDPALALWEARRTYFDSLRQSENLWVAMLNTAPFICVSQKVRERLMD
jgi:CHAT domain-containing protein